jgi:hypothetical protein
VLKVNGEVQGNIKYEIKIIERDISFGFDLMPDQKLQLEYNTGRATTSFNDELDDITDITLVSGDNNKKFTNWGFNKGLQPNKGAPSSISNGIKVGSTYTAKMYGKEFKYKVLKVNREVQGNIKYEIKIIERDISFGFDLMPDQKLQLEYNTGRATTSFNDELDDITDITLVSGNNGENKKKLTERGFNKGSPSSISNGGKKKKVVKRRRRL